VAEDGNGDGDRNRDGDEEELVWQTDKKGVGMRMMRRRR
jgi:hypothetical protein